MSEVNLHFEVHCQKPDWILNHPDKKYNLSRYRIYVDDNLLTERNWIWNNNIFLNENIWIRSELNSTHTLKLIPVVYIPEQAVFTLDNFQVANFQADSTKINDLQVNFILR